MSGLSCEFKSIRNAGNTPYLPFPQTLDYVPTSRVKSITTTVPVTEMQYSPLSVSYQVPLSGSVDDVSVFLSSRMCLLIWRRKWRFGLMVI